MYSQQVSEIDAMFVDLIQTAWRDRLIQPILTFLGDRALPAGESQSMAISTVMNSNFDRPVGNAGIGTGYSIEII